MAEGNKWLGFNTTQINTLINLLGENPPAEAIANLNAWATDTATLLNAEAQITGTYDTDPQA